MLEGSRESEGVGQIDQVKSNRADNERVLRGAKILNRQVIK